jgi:cell division protein FtsN
LEFAHVKKHQLGNVIVGIIIGVVLGLAAALAVAVYVTKVPVPFMNKGQSRTAEQDAAETRKNRDWDPNAPLHGKNPQRQATTPAPQAAVAPQAAGSAAAVPQTPGAAVARPAAPAASPPAVVGRPSGGDPLGDFAAARMAAADPFLYFVQAGAFRSAEEAEAQRVKLSLMGFDAKVTEREQSGRQVFRVRVGPFEKKEDADRQKEKLDAGGVETALVRVQR